MKQTYVVTPFGEKINEVSYPILKMHKIFETSCGKLDAFLDTLAHLYFIYKEALRSKNVINDLVVKLMYDLLHIGKPYL